jgi:signal peptidase II
VTAPKSPWTARLALLALLLATLAVDQWTKLLARTHFGLPGGEPDYFKVKRLIGEWLQLRLVYNTGAAFGMRPQQLAPGLNPTVFYVLFSAVAIGFLLYLFRRVPRGDTWQKAGIVLILSGAFGNLIDRLRFAKVTDFIDVGIPGYAWRWPTFNIADSCVCVGVAMLILASRKPVPADASAPPPAPGRGSPSGTDAGAPFSDTHP